MYDIKYTFYFINCQGKGGPYHKRKKVYELNKCMLLFYSLRSPEDKIKWIFNVFDR